MIGFVPFKVSFFVIDRFNLSFGIDIGNLPQYVKQGVLMEITPEMVQELAPDLYEKAIAYEPNWLNFAKVD